MNPGLDERAGEIRSRIRRPSLTASAKPGRARVITIVRLTDHPWIMLGALVIVFAASPHSP
ncbi:MAG: hypothetical protein M3O70_02885, partial [Actinomycetota bacterium]|nr:hypothetical protein [Actinomycetota bacterium]